MSNLISILGGRVIALKDDVVITDEMIEQFKSYEVKDIDKELVDIPNSLALLDEIPVSPIIYNDGNFHNDLDNNVSACLNIGTHVIIAPEYRIGNEQIPELMKSAGLQIRRKEHMVFVEWSDEKNDLVFKDENGNISKTKKEADIDALGNMTVHDALYLFTVEDFRRIKEIEQITKDKGLYEILRMPEKDQMLYFMHSSAKEEGQSKYNKIIHELKHFKNKNIAQTRLMTEGGGELSAEDYYKLRVEDERTASLAEVIDAVNKYLEKGNLDDLTMFKGKKWITEKLADTPISDRQRFVLDMDFIVNSTLDNWDNEHRKDYEPQFAHWVGGFYPKHYPLSKTVENKEEYSLQKSAMYNFSIYNPATGNYVNKDLSRNVLKEIEIPEIIQTKVIDPAKEEIAKRKSERREKINTGRVDNKIIDEALEFFRRQFDNTTFASALKSLKEKGLDEYSAWDYKNIPNFNIAREADEEISLQTKKSVPAPTQKEKAGDMFTIDWDDNSPGDRLAKIRKKIANKIGVEKVKLPRVIKRIEYGLSDSLFKNRS